MGQKSRPAILVFAAPGRVVLHNAPKCPTFREIRFGTSLQRLPRTSPENSYSPPASLENAEIAEERFKSVKKSVGTSRAKLFFAKSEVSLCLSLSSALSALSAVNNPGWALASDGKNMALYIMGQRVKVLDLFEEFFSDLFLRRWRRCASEPHFLAVGNLEEQPVNFRSGESSMEDSGRPKKAVGSESDLFMTPVRGVVPL
jgi:hypothetical protein